MAVVRCNQGHYYDDEKFSRCPHCGIFAGVEEKKGKNVEKKGFFSAFTRSKDDSKTVAKHESNYTDNRPMEDTVTVSLESVEKAPVKKPSDDGKTIGMFSATKGNDYVTGWLVCIDGVEKGRDFRIRHGFNWIGRDYDMDVILQSDISVSRQKHCAIVYDDRGNSFSIVPNAGNELYKNGQPIHEPESIKTGDIIRVGMQNYEFIAFCREGREWEKE